MKTVNKILLASLALFGVAFTSCDTLDQPYHEGYENVPFTTPENVRSAAVGMYNLMQNAEFLGGRAQIYADVRSMDTNPSSYFGALSSMNGSLTSTFGQVRDGWRGGYRTLGEINLFIEKLTAAEGLLTETEHATYINEARFLRGVVYFYILNLWGDQYTAGGSGLGVPWIDRPFNDVTAFTDEAIVARSTTAKVYEKIIDDLTAATALPKSRGSGDASKYFATNAAAWAMLSRVYLYTENYEAAIEAATKVTGYSLDAEPAKNTFVLPPSSSKEIIFWIAHNDTDNPNTNNSLGQHFGMNGRADITLSSDYLSLFDKENDIRFKTLIVSNKAQTSFFTNKYPDKSWNWAPVIRYGEVILNEAEARAKKATGVDEPAIVLLNRIRARAGVSLVAAEDFADKAALVEFILAERRRELAFEGHGSFDLFRNKKGIPAGRGSSKASAIPYPNDLFALPIPDRDIIKGKGTVVQNPGY